MIIAAASESTAAAIASDAVAWKGKKARGSFFELSNPSSLLLVLF